MTKEVIIDRKGDKNQIQGRIEGYKVDKGFLWLFGYEHYDVYMIPEDDIETTGIEFKGDNHD